MSYDLEILVEGRKHLKNEIVGNIRIEVNSRCGGRNRYTDTFLYMAEKRGAWCSLFETDREQRFMSAFNIADIKTTPQEDISYPFWEDRHSGMCVLTIREDYKDSFRDVMRHLQNYSPKNRIFFLPRLQGGEYDNVCGVITMERFFELLDSGRILFNIAYIIQN